MLQGYSVVPNADENVEELPDNEAEFFNAKTFLQTASGNTGDNLYDHLTDVLNKILAERPENIIDYFEEYSRKVKEQRYRPLTDRLEDIYITPGTFELATKMMTAMKPLPPKPPSTVDPDDLEHVDMSNNNLLEMLFYLEQAGLGLPRQEMAFVMLSMRQFADQKPITSVRFWGKIFGSFRNYLVLETELKEEEYMKRNEKAAEEAEKEAKALQEASGNPTQSDLDKALETIMTRPGDDAEEEGEGAGSKVPRKLPPEPQIQYQEPKEPTVEASGTGLNKKVYYVCTEIGGQWIELPDVTPKEVRVARQIYKSFSGNLDKDICSYPEFSGKEKNLLRAQISRISSGTQVAPLGYYTFGGDEGPEGGEEEEEEEEAQEAPGGENKTVYRVNTKYDPPALKDLLDRSMPFWVHTAPYILNQGRVTWWNPGPDGDQGDQDEVEGEQEEAVGEEEEEDDRKAPKVEPETGPPLLTPLSEDASLETTTPWTVRSTSVIMDMYPLVLVRSNLWPGAYAMTTPSKSFYNIYLGFGLKYMQTNYSPTPLPQVQQEYPVGPEILEVLDPTGHEEEQWRIDHLPKPKPPDEEHGEEAEGEQEEAEEEEEEEDED